MSRTMLFSEAPTAAAAEVSEVPPEVEALDGIADEDEAHNVERPARQSLKKKGPRGKPLSEFKVGDTVKAKVKTVTAYGAFCDIGATTDGLIHISQLAVGFVSAVDSVLKEGQEVEVRIIKIDEGKSQVGLSMLTADQQEAAVEAASSARQSRSDNNNNNRPAGGGRPDTRDARPARRDDSGILNKLVEKGWDPEKFIEGTVASTIDFGAFVRVDVSQLNAEVEGEIDGLVHISALSPNRITDVKSVVKVDDKVQVRVKSIADRKVSLTMLSLADEATKAETRGGGGGGGGKGEQQVGMGAKDWKESLERMQVDMPTFTNKPLVVDMRK